jgi:hypothetical protein
MINELTLQSYYKRIKQSLSVDDDYKIAFLGLACNHLFQALQLKILHEKNEQSILEKIKEIKNMLHASMYTLAFECKNLNYLPRGKRELVYFAQKKWFWGVYFAGLLSIWYLKIKRHK